MVRLLEPTGNCQIERLSKEKWSKSWKSNIYVSWRHNERLEIIHHLRHPPGATGMSTATLPLRPVIRCICERQKLKFYFEPFGKNKISSAPKSHSPNFSRPSAFILHICTRPSLSRQYVRRWGKKSAKSTVQRKKNHRRQSVRRWEKNPANPQNQVHNAKKSQKR